VSQSIFRRENLRAATRAGDGSAKERVSNDHLPWQCRVALDLYPQYVQDRLCFKMKLSLGLAAGVGVLAFLAGGALARAQGVPSSDAKTYTGKSDPTSRVTIEVSGGEKGSPVENASVYLKYVEEHKLKKDRKVELNVKTNREGTAHIPEAPTGRVLLQVVAEGWKTYGRWYDITEAKQTIKVHLEKPPKWY
jgi:hypothetical protein